VYKTASNAQAHFNGSKYIFAQEFSLWTKLSDLNYDDKTVIVFVYQVFSPSSEYN